MQLCMCEVYAFGFISGYQKTGSWKKSKLFYAGAYGVEINATLYLSTNTRNVPDQLRCCT